MDTAEGISVTLVDAAEKVSRKFTKVFSSFAQCHNGYNSSHRFSDSQIDTLGRLHLNLLTYLTTRMFSTDKDIKSFMANYREVFPAASVLPKMHNVREACDRVAEKAQSGICG